MILSGATCYSPRTARRKRDLDRALWERADLETLQLLADGHTGSQIANRLHVSDRTVRRSMERMGTKIRATSNQEAGGDRMTEDDRGRHSCQRSSLHKYGC
jgi:DNA-binding NarL/FixJ family response regulator